MPLIETLGSGGVRGFGLFGKGAEDGLTAGGAARSAQFLKTTYPSYTSGVYWIDWNGPKQIYCDMSLEGGGWMMILNYVHQAGTNPALLTRTDSFPLLNRQYTFGDESGSTAVGGSWGHISNSLAAGKDWTQYMFYGKTGFHSRIIHWKGTDSAIVNYIKTGIGSMRGNGAYNNGFNNSSTNQNASLYSNASIPLYCRESSELSGYADSGDLAMTEFPIYGNSTIGNPRAHWGSKGGGTRWEVDDFPENQGGGSGSPGGYSQNTIHRIWVK